MAVPGFARVFWQRGGALGPGVFEAMPQWQQIYQTRVSINGQPGRLQVWGCDEALAAVMAKLSTAFAAQTPPPFWRASASAGWGLIQDKQSVMRVLALSPGAPAPTPTLIFVLTQTQKDLERSLQPAPDYWPSQAPVYPGSQLLASIEDESAAAQLEIVSAAAPPRAVSSFFESAFAQDQYSCLALTPLADQSGGVMAVFQKDMAISCVLVQSSPLAAGSMITMLHKRLGIE